MGKVVAERILVTGYVNPDLDAYACAAAYAEFLKLQGQDAWGGCFGKPQNEVIYTLNLLDEPQLDWLDPAQFDSFVVVDTSDAFHLPRGVELSRVAEVIDHHLYNDTSLFSNADLDIQAVGAAATLITERFRDANITPRRAIAALLYAAIISNTLNFKASVTTDRDAAAAGWLLPLAKLPKDFAYDLFKNKSDVRGEKLRELVHLEMNPLEIDGKIFIIGALELIGVPQLLSERQAELESMMRHLHMTKRSHVTFLSLSDVHLGKTYFVTPFDHVREVLQEVLEIEFENSVAEFPGIILRKEYVGQVRQRFLAKLNQTKLRPTGRNINSSGMYSR